MTYKTYQIEMGSYRCPYGQDVVADAESWDKACAEARRRAQLNPGIVLAATERSWDSGSAARPIMRWRGYHIGLAGQFAGKLQYCEGCDWKIESGPGQKRGNEKMSKSIIMGGPIVLPPGPIELGKHTHEKILDGIERKASRLQRDRADLLAALRKIIAHPHSCTCLASVCTKKHAANCLRNIAVGAIERVEATR